MKASQIPKSKRFKLWSEAAKTETALDNLIPVMWKEETKTGYEHAGHKISNFIKYLRKFGEAGTVMDKKDGKVGDRGITMLFVGYADGLAGFCYGMYNRGHHEFASHKTLSGLGGCTLPLRTVTKQHYCHSLRSQSQMMCPMQT